MTSTTLRATSTVLGLRLGSPRQLLGALAYAVVSLAAYLAAASGTLPLGTTEVLGFVTGAASVWLTVRVSVWNFPVSIANEVMFFLLFWDARLYADALLQVIYFVLTVYGWYWWLRGGPARTAPPITRVPRAQALVLAALAVIGTGVLTAALVVVNDAAPFLDALTTVLSLVAMFLLVRKHVETWYLWITADVIYIYLYWSRELPLTAVLYGVFLAMCIVGLRDWRRALAAPRTDPATKDAA